MYLISWLHIDGFIANFHRTKSSLPGEAEQTLILNSLLFLKGLEQQMLQNDLMNQNRKKTNIVRC